MATVVTEMQIPHLAAWQQALKAQETTMLWDVAVVDGTDFPSPGYVRRLHAWSKASPFGPEHRVRLLRIGYDADGRMFAGAGTRVSWARQLLWARLARWASYEHLMLLDIDVAPPPPTLERLYKAGQQWAVALLNGRVQPMRCALLHGDVVRSVPFQLSLDGDLEYSRACTERGIYPALVPVT